jgi:hypothetical protein
MKTPDIAAAFRKGREQILQDFEGLQFTEQTEEVFRKAARHAVERREWLNDDNLMLALSTCGTAVPTVLEAQGVRLNDLMAAINCYPPTGVSDPDLPDFWLLSDTGPTVAALARSRGLNRIDTVTLAAGIIQGAFTRSRPGRRSAVLDVFDGLRFSLPALFEAVSRYNFLDPCLEDLQLALTNVHNRISLRETGLIDGFRYDATPDGKPGIIVAKANLLHDCNLIPSSLVDDFEHLINRSDISEHDLQRFFEQHPEFLLGLEYKSLHAQLTLFRQDAPALRPDFFLEKADSTFCDIVDLKKPNACLVKHPRNRPGFVSALYDAIHQLREYRDYFEDAARRKAFERKYGLQAYRPDVTVIIGRSSDYLSYVERIRIEDGLAAHFKILTYDDVLSMARRRQFRLAQAFGKLDADRDRS